MTTETESIFDSGFDSVFVPGEQEATKMQIETIENKDTKNRRIDIVKSCLGSLLGLK